MTVDGLVVGEIGTGLAVLLGVTHDDTIADSEALAAKVAALRIFSDQRDAMNLSVSEVGGAVLVVSQFTLYGDVSRGRRPSFTAAAPGQVAEPLVEAVAVALERTGLTVARGVFGAKMEVELVNHGPVTILLETRNGRHSGLD